MSSLMMKNNRDNQELNLIISFLQSGDGSELPVHLKERLDRIDLTDNLIRRHGRKKAASMLQTKYDIVKSTAYKLINDAMYVYNSSHKLQKEYWRNLLLDMQYAELIRCKDKGDSKGFNMAMKNLIEIVGLNRDDNKITAEMLQQHTIQFNISFNGGAEKYEISADKIKKLSIDERLKIVKAAEAETIDFDMIEFIEQSENEAGE